MKFLVTKNFDKFIETKLEANLDTINIDWSSKGPRIFENNLINQRRKNKLTLIWMKGGGDNFTPTPQLVLS